VSPAAFNLEYSLERLQILSSILERFQTEFERIPDLERFKPFFDRFELTPSFALDTTGPSLIQK
jgi:hypothetical protein